MPQVEFPISTIKSIKVRTSPSKLTMTGQNAINGNYRGFSGRGFATVTFGNADIGFTWKRVMRISRPDEKYFIILESCPPAKKLLLGIIYPQQFDSFLRKRFVYFLILFPEPIGLATCIARIGTCLALIIPNRIKTTTP